MTTSVLERVAAAAVFAGVKKGRVVARAAIDQDLSIYGDAADDFVDALSIEFGEWVRDWPWDRFVDFNEAVVERDLSKIWRGLRKWLMGTDALNGRFERLELGDIAAVIEKGQWIEP